MDKLLRERETTAKCAKMRTLTPEQQIEKIVQNMRTQALARSGVLKNPKNIVRNY